MTRQEEITLSDLVFNAVVAYDKARAAYVAISNDLLEDAKPDVMGYEFRYDHYMVMDSICLDYLYDLGKILEEVRAALDEAAGTQTVPIPRAPMMSDERWDALAAKSRAEHPELHQDTKEVSA